MTSFSQGLQGVIEIVRQDDVGSNDFAVAERGDELRRQIHEHEAGADIVGGALDLSKAMHGGGIDTGNQAIIKYEEAGIGPLRKQLFDLLVEAIGRAEEEVALQAHALDLAAVVGKNSQFLRSTVERGAVFGALEAEFDGVHPAGADGEGGAADDHADQHAGDKADLDDEQGNGKQRGVFEERNAACRVNEPLLDEVEPQIEQQSAKHELGYISEEARIGGEHEPRDDCHDKAGEPSTAARRVVQGGPAQRDATDIATKRGPGQIGDAERLQVALEVGFASGDELDSGGVEQHGDRRYEHDGQQIGDVTAQRPPGKYAEIV
jgi:hypothetical protein